MGLKRVEQKDEGSAKQVNENERRERERQRER
jgi:hypothetical protein